MIDEFEIWFHISGREKLESADAFYETSYAKERGWDVNKPDLLDISPYIHFFVGDNVDYDHLINTLRKIQREEATTSEKTRLNEFIEDFKQRRKGAPPTTKAAEKAQQYQIFKEALEDFNKSYPNLVSEVRLGKTKFDIKRNRNTLIEFKEKAVDTKLVMQCMDDQQAQTNMMLLTSPMTVISHHYLKE